MLKKVNAPLFYRERAFLFVIVLSVFCRNSLFLWWKKRISGDIVLNKRYQ